MAIDERQGGGTGEGGGGSGPGGGGELGDARLNLLRYGDSAAVQNDILRQNMMNSWWNNFAGGLPMSMAAGNTGLNTNFGMGQTGVIGGPGGGVPLQDIMGALGKPLGDTIGGEKGQIFTDISRQVGGDPRYLGGGHGLGGVNDTGSAPTFSNILGIKDKISAANGTAAPPPVDAPDLSFLGQGGGGGGAGADFYTWLAGQRAQQGNPQLQRTGIDWTGYGSGLQAPPTQPTPTPYSAYPGAPAPPPAPPAPTSGQFRPGGVLGAETTNAPPTGGGGQPPPPPAPAPSSGAMSPLAKAQTAAFRADDTDEYTGPPVPAPPAPPPAPSGAPPKSGGTPIITQPAPAAAPPPPPPPAPPSGYATGGPSGALPAQRGAQTSLETRPANTPANQGATSQSFVPGKPYIPPGSPGGTGIAPVGQFANPVFQQQQQTRNEQGGLLNRLKSDMEGGAPSLAQIALRKGTDENIAAANAIAASGGPGNAAAASRQAALSAAKANQDLVGQSAALRAQEYVQARQEATGLANQLRVNDLTATGMSYDNAVKQAQLEADQAKTQLGADVSMAGIRAGQEQGLLDLGLRDKALASDQQMHVADLLMQKYGIDKGVAVQMANQPGVMDYIMKGAATGGAVGGVPGAFVGGLSGWLYGDSKRP